MSACGLCRRPLDDARLVGETSRHGHASRRVACLMCGLVQVSPQPTEGALAEFYSSHAYRNEHGQATLTITQHGVRRQVHPGDPRYGDALDTMAGHRHRWTSEIAGLVRGMRVLEIGCGDGRTLAKYAEAGMICTGVEPDHEEAAKAAPRLPPSAKVHAATYQQAKLEPPYDAIVSFHVLEHLRDPIAALKDWREMLTPRGALLLEVPDILHPSLPIDTNHLQWVHLFDFSKHTLSGCLVRSGLEPVQVEHAPGTAAIRALARPAASAVDYEMPHGGAYVEGYLDALRGAAWMTF